MNALMVQSEIGGFVQRVLAEIGGLRAKAQRVRLLSVRDESFRRCSIGIAGRRTDSVRIACRWLVDRDTCRRFSP